MKKAYICHILIVFMWGALWAKECLRYWFQVHSHIMTKTENDDRVAHMWFTKVLLTQGH